MYFPKLSYALHHNLELVPETYSGTKFVSKWPQTATENLGKKANSEQRMQKMTKVAQTAMYTLLDHIEERSGTSRENK